MKNLQLSPKRKKVLEELWRLKVRNGKVQSHPCTPVRGLDTKRVQKPNFAPFSVWEYKRKIN